MPLTLLVMVLYTPALRNFAACVYGRNIAFRSLQCIQILLILKPETLTALAESYKLK
jgi:hypothetical protein